MSLLNGGLILCPEHDKQKWRNEKDEEKSSIPIVLFLKSRKALRRFGLTPEDYPSVEEFIEEGKKLLSQED